MLAQDFFQPLLADPRLDVTPCDFTFGDASPAGAELPFVQILHAIQRAEDLVGIAIPIVPLSSAFAAPARAANPSVKPNANLFKRILFPPKSGIFIVGAGYAPALGGQGLRPAKA